MSGLCLRIRASSIWRAARNASCSIVIGCARTNNASAIAPVAAMTRWPANGGSGCCRRRARKRSGANQRGWKSSPCCADLRMPRHGKRLPICRFPLRRDPAVHPAVRARVRVPVRFVRERRIRTQAFGKSSKPGRAGKRDKTPENGGNALRGGAFYAMPAPNWAGCTLFGTLFLRFLRAGVPVWPLQ